MRVHVILCLSINIYTSIYIYVNNIFSNKQTKKHNDKRLQRINNRPIIRCSDTIFAIYEYTRICTQIEWK